MRKSCSTFQALVSAFACKVLVLGLVRVLFVYIMAAQEMSSALRHSQALFPWDKTIHRRGCACFYNIKLTACKGFQVRFAECVAALFTDVQSAWLCAGLSVWFVRRTGVGHRFYCTEEVRQLLAPVSLR